ncbi:MAG: response regulator transcription factor [Saprospiraceae bacterium]|nr:response regulator transcription factor [Saprospiraceae bacterium]
MKILLVEDNPELSQDISAFLHKEGHVCETAGSIRTAEDKILEFEYDIIVLDLMLPDGNGLQILRNYQKHRTTENTGILIISAKNALEDRVDGLDLGADDYLTKPFHFSELNSRLNAIYRRRQFNGNRSIKFEEISIDPQQQEVTVHGDEVILTKKEYQLLVHFIANKNRVLTKQSIAEHLWGDHVDYLDSYDFVYQHIKNLRKKLSKAGSNDYLTNVYGMGYRLKT